MPSRPLRRPARSQGAASASVPPLTPEAARQRVAGLPRATLLRLASSALGTAARREGQPGTTFANRQAVMFAAGCLLELTARER